MSLLYECINTVIAVLISISSGMPNHTAAIQLCVQKLRILIEDSDQVKIRLDKHLRIICGYICVTVCS